MLEPLHLNRCGIAQCHHIGLLWYFGCALPGQCGLLAACSCICVESANGGFSVRVFTAAHVESTGACMLGPGFFCALLRGEISKV